MATLYRKYRPQNFEEVVGQNHIKLTLEQEIKTGKIAHSYLFCGPRAVGKTTLARVFAKSLNCTKRVAGEAEPCNTCSACLDITQGNALDVIEIDAASHTSVENVRENIIANARISPVSLKYKVFIIDEVHMLSGSAFNALLKIMEEPPEFVIFILCTTEVHKIPATIISRCQRFDFKKISIVDIVKKLKYITQQEKIKVDQKILEEIARSCGGHMRDAESILGQIVALLDDKKKQLEITSEEAELVIPKSNLKEVLVLIDFLAKKDTAGAIRLVNKLVDDGFDLKVFVSDLIEILRQMILTKINPDLIASFGLDLGESLEEQFIKINKETDLNKLMFCISRFIKAKPELKTSFIIQLPLELAIIEICNQTTEAKTIIKKVEQQKKEENTKIETKSGQNNLDFENIKSRWPEFLNRIKQNNHSLSFILKSCQLTALNNNEITLTFKHKFHQERINELEIKHIVENVLSEVFNQQLAIKALLDENIVIENNNNSHEQETPKPSTENNNQDDDNNLNDVLKNFGGTVVE